MKVFFTSIIGVVIAFASNSLCFAQFEGGTTSNGGGPLAARGAHEIPYQDFLKSHLLLRKFVREEYEKSGYVYNRELLKTEPALLRCSNHPELPYYNFPASLADSFRIHVRQKKHFWSKPEVKPLQKSAVCGSPELLAALSDFTYTVKEFERDAVGRELLAAAIRAGGPVEIVIDEPVSMKAQFEEYEERTWFAAEDGRVHWAGLHRFDRDDIGRRDTQVLRHELMHVLLFRKLKDKYPRAAVWHSGFRVDREKFSMSDYYFLQRDELENEYHKQNTSPAAAFVEGLAGAIEIGEFYFRSPYVLYYNYARNLNVDAAHADGFNKLAPQPGADSQTQYCYSHPSVLKNDMGAWFVPMGSETLLGSSIALLMQKYSSFDGRVVGRPSVKRMKDLIHAIEKSAPRDIVELTRAFDKESGTKIGLRVLREFFRWDYLTGKDMAPYFYAASSGLRKGETLCLKSGFEKQFFSTNIQVEERLPEDDLMRLE